MNINLYPLPYPLWTLKLKTFPSLSGSIKTNVVIVGGGMTGLSAAQAFLNKGLSVAIVEKNYCGAGASGINSGFITPDSELSLTDLTAIYGQEAASQLWKFSLSGVDLIKNNIKNFSIDCDYQEQDTLVLANTKKRFDIRIKEEFENRVKLGYDAVLYNDKNLSLTVNSGKYHGAVSYGGSFGIQPFDYCQAMKDNLSNQGVLIFEDSPVIKVDSKGVYTQFGSVFADYIVLALDRFIPNLSNLKTEVYHAQTFLLVSKVLDEEQIKSIFPNKRYMVWDTDLIYQYYRITGENRLLLGGSSFLYNYSKNRSFDNKIVFNKLTKYFKNKFPQTNIEYEYMWPGMIGLSKDIMPIGGPDKYNSNIYYAGTASGLPWSAALGMYIADHAINHRTELDAYFSPYRKFFIGNTIQSFLGTKLSFALSNFLREKRIF